MKFEIGQKSKNPVSPNLKTTNKNQISQKELES